jgi:hypothetical protein
MNLQNEAFAEKPAISDTAISDTAIGAILRAPWTRKRSGSAEYLLDADGRTICTREANDAQHGALMLLLEKAPAMLRVLDAEFNPFSNEGMTPRQSRQAADELLGELRRAFRERTAGEARPSKEDDHHADG